MFSFERSHIQFTQSEISKIDPKVNGLFGIYNIRHIESGDNLEPIYWSYGKVREQLLRLLVDPRLVTVNASYCNYKENVKEPEIFLEQVKKDLPPLISLLISD
jgi:hypothetical protein